MQGQAKSCDSVAAGHLGGGGGGAEGGSGVGLRVSGFFKGLGVGLRVSGLLRRFYCKP